MYCSIEKEKGITIINALQKNLCKSKRRKTNKIWVDKGNKFYQRLMKSWLQYNNIEIYSINNEGKSVVAERFIRSLKNEVYKYMSAI